MLIHIISIISINIKIDDQFNEFVMFSFSLGLRFKSDNYMRNLELKNVSQIYMKKKIYIYVYIIYNYIIKHQDPL